MMKKTVKSRKVEAIVQSPQKTVLSAKEKSVYEFPQGVKFMLNGDIYVVSNAYFEMNTQMRKIQNHNTDEVIMLSSLQKEAISDSGFMILEK